jgi:hypothetical protein
MEKPQLQMLVRLSQGCFYGRFQQDELFLIDFKRACKLSLNIKDYNRVRPLGPAEPLNRFMRGLKSRSPERQPMKITLFFIRLFMMLPPSNAGACLPFISES